MMRALYRIRMMLLLMIGCLFLMMMLIQKAISAEHQDTKLQTRLTPQGLQKRLLDLYHDSKTLEEEQGVNILYLTLGTLKWIDPNNKEMLDMPL